MHIGAQYKERNRAYIIQPVNKSKSIIRDIDDIIEEAEGLARAIDLEVIKTHIVKLSKIQTGAFFGKGVRKDIAEELRTKQPSIVIVNGSLSPIQQRNLEKEWSIKIIDRTGLILEIFGKRAQTKEGRLQVELASLEYQRSRLVRSWTHLERQRGGAGFMGGPGERQIEIDRRLIAHRITRIKKELEDVKRTRKLGSQSRARIPLPIVSLVGYTNAGKSTLFNKMTRANVFAKDLPFATLDPTMRKIMLPNNQEAILADTVGFISDLPTHLVAAFRATLEQITQANVILHVIDVSRDDYIAQKSDVIDILQQLGVNYETDDRIIEIYNKIDQIYTNCLSEIKRICKISKKPMLTISAVDGTGIDQLLDNISQITSRNNQLVEYKINIQDGKALSWLYANGDVLSRIDSDKTIKICVNMDNIYKKKFEDRFKYSPSN